MLMKKYIIIAFIALFISGCSNDNNVNVTKADTLTTLQSDITANDANSTLTNQQTNASKALTLKNGIFDSGDLNLFNSTTIDLNLETPVTIKLYCSAELDENKQPQFDDNNLWSLVVESSDGYYEIINSSPIQLGDINYTAYFDENNKLNILITQSTTASYSVNNFTYDEPNKEFTQKPLLDLNNINKMAESNY